MSLLPQMGGIGKTFSSFTDRISWDCLIDRLSDFPTRTSRNQTGWSTNKSQKLGLFPVAANTSNFPGKGRKKEFGRGFARKTRIIWIDP
jgi:hypothetical protein